MRPPYANTAQLGFGQYFTDHMYTAKYAEGKGWYEKSISFHRPFVLDPAATSLHYAQEIFEGLKAYVSQDNEVLLFRPMENARRMNRSARRLCMPEFPEEDFIQAVTDLVTADRDWIPRDPGTSLYIRPTMIAVDPFLGLKVSKEYIFYIVLSPVGPYYKEGFSPVGIYVEEELTRAAAGGLGEAKTGGNYAASILSLQRAKEKGFAQVLFLDAKEHKYIEEVGAMNVFFVMGDTLVTPPLKGTILPGITRDSVIRLAADMEYNVEERPITIDEVVEKVESGVITEMFGTGTAAVISPVGFLSYRGIRYDINRTAVGKVSQRLYDCLTDIQYGRVKDPYDWVKKLGKVSYPGKGLDG